MKYIHCNLKSIICCNSKAILHKYSAILPTSEMLQEGNEVDS